MAIVTMQLVLLMGLMFCLAILLFGAPLVQLLLGVQYAPLLPLLFWFALQQALRVLKAGPAIIALSQGQTLNAMLANLVRVSALPFCWYVAVTSGDIKTILRIATLAELLGYGLSVWLLRRMIGVLEQSMLIPHLVTFTVLLGATVWQLSRADHGIAGPVVWLAAAVGIAAALASMRELRLYLRNRYQMPPILG